MSCRYGTASADAATSTPAKYSCAPSASRPGWRSSATASASRAGTAQAQTPDQQSRYGKNHRRNQGAVGKG